MEKSVVADKVSQTISGALKSLRITLPLINLFLFYTILVTMTLPCMPLSK